jgi:hypothetical protein
VKRSRWTIAILGICIVFCASIALPIDDPETPFNESEAPVSLATPVAIDTVARLVYVARTTAILGGQLLPWTHRAIKCAITEKRGERPSNSTIQSLFALLC